MLANFLIIKQGIAVLENIIQWFTLIRLWYLVYPLCFTPLHHLSIISFIYSHIKTISKAYLSRLYNDMGYVRL